MKRRDLVPAAACSLLCFMVLCGVAACGRSANSSAANVVASTSSPASPVVQSPSDAAPPADQTGGFDGAAAYDFTAKLVAFGPRPPDSPAIRQTQAYILAELKSFGCPVDVDDFHASTPIGDLAMKNIVVKIPGSERGIILLLTHYDTVRIPGFVGADDAGSSSGLMLEMARVLCSAKERQPNSVWIAFLDGEEAQVVQDGVAQWTDSDSLFGSRELAASMDLSGDLKRIRAVLLADMVGAKGLNIREDPGSTPWLNTLVWKTAARLGYQSVFIPSSNGGVEDDHVPFLRHHVPAADITEFPNYPYWHTTQDTMDKISPRSLAIAGHVFLEAVRELQQGRR
ncbi:MAG TPA: M28 family metallopeptidase [Verrucomicrobiae bacterium]|nr:M28 family metallopeptidase [Verrucomicrobiae bacterium]